MTVDLSRLNELTRMEIDAEFTLMEDEISQVQVFATEEEARHRELLKGLGVDASTLQSLEANDAQQAENVVRSLDLRTTQAGEVDAEELVVDEYAEEAGLDLLTAEREGVGSLASRWIKRGPPSAACGNDRKTHNEGGHTEGISECQNIPGTSLMFAHARGDGAGISDDNDVYLWSWHWYYWTPNHHGHIAVFPRAQYRGYAYSRANDKWYNSKDVTTRISMWCDVWQQRGTWKRLGSRSWDNYRLVSQNVNTTKWFNNATYVRSYGNEVVWADRPVAILVGNRIDAKTEGNGSISRVDFRNHGRHIKNWVWLRFSY